MIFFLRTWSNSGKTNIKLNLCKRHAFFQQQSISHLPFKSLPCSEASAIRPPSSTVSILALYGLLVSLPGSLTATAQLISMNLKLQVYVRPLPPLSTVNISGYTHFLANNERKSNCHGPYCWINATTNDTTKPRILWSVIFPHTTLRINNCRLLRFVSYIGSFQPQTECR